MTGAKEQSANQTYRQKQHLALISGNEKAARMTRTLLPGRTMTLSEWWGDALAVYGDYFIRY